MLKYIKQLSAYLYMEQGRRKMILNGYLFVPFTYFLGHSVPWLLHLKKIAKLCHVRYLVVSSRSIRATTYSCEL